MSSRLLKQILAAVVIVGASVGAAGAVSAAPVIAAAGVRPMQQAAVTPVYWIRRHGHKIWVRPHHH